MTPKGVDLSMQQTEIHAFGGIATKAVMGSSRRGMWQEHGDEDFLSKNQQSDVFHRYNKRLLPT